MQGIALMSRVAHL